MFLLCLLSTALFPSSTDAPPSLKIDGDLVIKPHRMAVLRAVNVPEGSALLWDIDQEEKCHVEECGARLLVLAPPGSYKVKLRAFRHHEGRTLIETARATLTFEGCKPLPPAPLPPPPSPPPGGPPRTDPIAATCRLRFGSSGCTATIVGPRRSDGRWDVITAAHCTGNTGSVGEITLKTGQRFKVTVLQRATGPDITWMVLDGTPEVLPYALLATTDPQAGTKVWHMGYGVDRPGNREEGTVTGGPLRNGQLSFRLNVSSGDSGSGIFREDTGELVGVVCCTTGTGRLVTMYGGASTTALKLRPSPPAREENTPIDNPVPIPEVPEALEIPQ